MAPFKFHRPMATRTPPPEKWWETALAALGLGGFLVGAFLMAAMLQYAGTHEPEERCFSLGSTQICRTQHHWE